MTASVRVDKFTWEKLMLSSSLPYPTKSMLMILSAFMGADGDRARPGFDGLAKLTGRSKSTISLAINDAVAAGYLIQVERGGFRQGVNRASEYAAAVPAEAFERRAEILGAAPWSRSRDTRRSGEPDVRVLGVQDEGPTGRTLVSDEGPVSRTFAEDEGPISGDEGPVFQDQGPADRTPSSSYIKYPHQPKDPNGGEGAVDPSQDPGSDDPYVTTVRTHRPDWTSAQICDAVARSVGNGHDEAHARRALLSIAAGNHGETKVPGRVIQNGPWWAATAHVSANPVDERCARHPGRRATTCGRCLAEKPACPHGQCGGAEPSATTGLPPCALCRRAALRLAEAA